MHVYFTVFILHIFILHIYFTVGRERKKQGLVSVVWLLEQMLKSLHCTSTEQLPKTLVRKP